MNVYTSNPIHRYDLSKVGKGYRNACWLPPSKGRGGRIGVGRMWLAGYDKEGNEAEFTFPFYPSVKYEVKTHTREKDLYGKFLETRWFDDTQARRQWCASMEDKVRIISCYPPEQEFLMDVFGKHVFDDDFNQQFMRTHYLDIEVAIENEFPEPEDAKYPINLVTVFDNKDSRFHSWALGDVNNTLDGMDVDLRTFRSEADLLKDYLDWHRNNYPSMISGWNCVPLDTHVWKKDRIARIDSLVPGDVLCSSSVVNVSPETRHDAYEITLSDGTRIVSSKDHLFPVSVHSSSYRIKTGTIFNTMSVKSVEEIVELMKPGHGRTLHMVAERGDNRNKGMTWREWLLHAAGELSERMHFGVVGGVFSAGNRIPVSDRIEDVDEIRRLVSEEKILHFVRDDGHTVCLGLGEYIGFDILHLTGSAYAAGVPERNGCSVTFFDANLTFCRRASEVAFGRRWREDDFDVANATRGVFRVGGDTPAALLVPMAFDRGGARRMDVGVMSTLSRRQFLAFAAGVFDMCGEVRGPKSSLRCDGLGSGAWDFQELLRWNGVVSAVTKDGRVRIVSTEIKAVRKSMRIWNSVLLNSLREHRGVRIWKNRRQDAEEGSMRISGDRILLKVVSVRRIGTGVPMMDIETTTHFFLARGVRTHNCRMFDITYIVRRLENVLGEKNARLYSPVGRYAMREDKKQYGKKYMSVRGISNLDMLFLYRDKFTVKAALDGGYGLDNVANEEIEDAKLHYDGSMLDFYKKDFQRFWEYNVQDVNLVVKLDAKLNLTKIARKITSFGCSQLESIYATISYIIASQDIYSRNTFGRTFLSYSKSGSIGKDVEQYEGAFVFPTYAGLYTQGVGTVDVNSLYPNTARSLNLSPETMVGTVEKIDLDGGKTFRYSISFVDGRTAEMDEESFERLLETTCILARNNVLFLKHEVQKGIFSEWCGKFFNMRKSYKKLKARYKDMRQELADEIAKRGTETPEEHARLAELDALVEQYDTTQYALKILINSAYGTLGTTYSPLYDTRLAEAITLNGQFCNRSTSKFLNEYFQKNYGTSEKFNITISGDTDSVRGDMELDLLLNEVEVKIPQR